MLPLRATFEAFGAKVNWDDATHTVTATKGDTTVQITIGSNIMTVNGEEKIIDVAAYTENGRTMVPVRACAEAFGLQVDWDEATHTIRVRKEVSVPIEERESYEDYTTYYSYDDFGSLIYIFTSNNTWTKYTYDEYGNMILEEHSDAVRYWWVKRTYDGRGRIVYAEDSYGNWERLTYDENDNMIHREHTPGRFYWSIHSIYQININSTWESLNYTSDGKLLNAINSEGDWEKHEYDNAGHEICHTTSHGKWHKSEYDKNGKLSYYEDSDGVWIKIEYDKNGYPSYRLRNNGEWEKSEYDDFGHLLYEVNSDGLWRKYTYDENGRLVMSEGSDEQKLLYDKNENILFWQRSENNWHKYEYDENGIPSYFENSDGYIWSRSSEDTTYIIEGPEDLAMWGRAVYDLNGNLLRFDGYDGSWSKCEYDEHGNILYREEKNIDEAQSSYTKYKVVTR